MRPVWIAEEEITVVFPDFDKFVLSGRDDSGKAGMEINREDRLLAVP